MSRRFPFGIIWLPSRDVLAKKVLIPVSDSMLQENLNFFITQSGNWNFDIFWLYLHLQWLMEIADVRPRVNQNDKPLWGPSSDGCFSTKSAFLSLTSDHQRQPFHWDSIWKWEGPEKIGHFLRFLVIEV